VILGPASIKDHDKQEVSCYPNPFQDKIFIKHSTRLLKSEIYDYSGKLVLESDSSEINVSELHSGLYSIKVTLVNGANYYQKLLKL